MSKISLSPSPTGSAVYTIASPAGSTDRTLNLPDNSGTLLSNASTGAVVQAMLETLVVPVGVNQTWQSPSRAVGVTYTNTTGRPIYVTVYFTNCDINREAILSTDGRQISAAQAASGADRITVTGIIRAGAEYSVATRFGGTSTLAAWFELR